MANIEIGHVPYKGGPPGFVDVLGGRMPMILSGFQGALPHIKTNSVKALAVTSKTRAAALPDTPTVAEALNLPDYEVLNWQGLFFPVNTPEAIVERIAAEVKEILAQDDTKQRLESFGYVPVGSTPTEFKKMVETEQKIWADIIKSANISKQF
jgi:tripartite-type tricarboxylate transporter receptor subunit TctC